MKSLTFLLICLSILLTAQTNPALNQTSALAGKPLKISRIKKQKPQKGIFTTQGYVAKIYVCPPCPPDTRCKPCMRDNIVISEENKSFETYELTEKELIIFTNAAKKLVKGKKYTFKIRITDRKSTGEPLNDIELVSYKII